MKAIEENVGPYRPIMQPNVERIISNAHRRGASAADIEKELEGITAAVTMDLDLLNTEIEKREPVVPKVTMAELTRILNSPGLMPEGWSSVPAGRDHWRVTGPNGQQWTVTTDRTAHDYAPAGLEWWGPGSRAFPRQLSKAVQVRYNQVLTKKSRTSFQGQGEKNMQNVKPFLIRFARSAVQEPAKPENGRHEKGSVPDRPHLI